MLLIWSSLASKTDGEAKLIIKLLVHFSSTVNYRVIAFYDEEFINALIRLHATGMNHSPAERLRYIQTPCLPQSFLIFTPLS